MNTENINIGPDCEELINKYYHQLVHTEKFFHVLKELKAYADLASVGSYCIVFDTVIEDMPEETYPDRPWGIGNNPKTAVWEFLEENDDFEIDKDIENKILITVASDGYLKRIK